MTRILITSGTGPSECQYAAHKIADILEKELSSSRIEDEKSHVILSTNEDISEVKDLFGIYQCIFKSKTRPHHGRKNWYIKVEKLDEVGYKILDKSKLKFTSCKSRGPGGQNVNKRSTAVRVTDGENSFISHSHRTQLQNKKEVLKRLSSSIDRTNRNLQSQDEKNIFLSHHDLERGNPIRVYIGHKFKRKI